MIKIFKSDYPIVIFFTLIALIALRIPFMIYEIPLLQLELKWMIVGEKLSEGGFLYRDLLTNLEPWSAGTYWLFNLMSGRSVSLLRVSAMILIFIQALLLSIIIRRRKSFERIGYLPSLVYVLLTSSSREFNTLSPQLLGSTFLIISLNYLFNMPAEKKADNQILNSGICVGIAALFYFPFITFLAMVWFSMALYRSDNFRELLLVIVGCLIPVMCTGLYYFFNGCLTDFISYLMPVSYRQTFSLMPSWQQIVIVLTVPVFAFLIAYNFLKRNFYSSTMHVKNCRQIIVFWILVSLISLLWVRKIYTMSFLILLAPFAVIISFGLYVSRSYRKAEMILILTIIAIFGVNIYTLNFSDSKLSLYSNDYFINQNPLPDTLKNKNILVMAEKFQFFYKNKLGSPYLDWSYIKRDFSQLNNYRTVYEVYTRLINDLPDFVIDENNLFESFLNKAPLMSSYFEQIPGTVVYRRKGEHPKSSPQK